MRDVGLNELGSVASLLGFAAMGTTFVRGLLEGSPQSALPAGPTGLTTLVALGASAAVLHGILWTLLERLSGMAHGAGARSLPQGWEAVALSLTRTVPLLIAPVAYASMTGIAVAPPRHMIAGVFVVIATALAHLVLYGMGSPRLRGIRRAVLPIGATPNPERAVLMELLYAIAHFTSIVIVYRAVVHPGVGPLDGSVLAVALTSAGVFFLGVCIFLLLKWPDSVTDESWVQVRGVISGLLLMVTLQGGMLM